MPISSLIIKTKKESTDSVIKQIEMINEMTVSKVHNGNIVVVTETQTQSQDKDLWRQIEGISGVLQCDLIYHNFEDEEGFNNGK